MMIPPHTHTREDECNFVLRGELTCDVGGEIVVAPAGSYVLKPRGVPHALCNTGTEPVWVVEILTPGGFEAYFDEYEEIASKLASGEISDEEHLRARTELGERYGVVWHDERIPEARERFGMGPSGALGPSLPLIQHLYTEVPSGMFSEVRVEPGRVRSYLYGGMG